MKKIAIIISGCGVYDGAEIHETVMTMLSVVKHGASYQLFAPDSMQHHVINHLTGEEMSENRNVLIESARIARGNIKNLEEYRVSDFDAIIFPGGFGVAKNLFTFAFDGVKCKVNPEVERVILETHQANKPIGALCIAPVLIAKVIKGSTVTIGHDKETAEAITNMGSHHINAAETDVVSDLKNKIFSTPCYMLEADISDIATSTDNLVETMLNHMT